MSSPEPTPEGRKTAPAGIIRTNLRPLKAEPWRVVEAQHRVSTRKLVDSDAEQLLLEQLLETAKPPLPDARPGPLHYLLVTPFRYPPLARGSRFGARWEPGLWYGSDTRLTAFAEVAYYRFVFLEGTDARLGPIETDLTAYRVPVATRRGIDLTRSAFEPWRARLASRTSYAETQPFGAAMREAGVEIVRYVSARDAASGTNVALFTPAAFAARRPKTLQTWHSVTARTSVEFGRLDYVEREHVRFPRDAFLVDGVLPQPAIR